jgi:hypothetical protein
MILQSPVLVTIKYMVGNKAVKYAPDQAGA